MNIRSITVIPAGVRGVDAECSGHEWRASDHKNTYRSVHDLRYHIKVIRSPRIGYTVSYWPFFRGTPLTTSPCRTFQQASHVADLHAVDNTTEDKRGWP